MGLTVAVAGSRDRRFGQAAQGPAPQRSVAVPIADTLAPISIDITRKPRLRRVAWANRRRCLHALLPDRAPSPARCMSQRCVPPSRGEVWLADLGLAAKVRPIRAATYTHFRAWLHPTRNPARGDLCIGTGTRNDAPKPRQG